MSLWIQVDTQRSSNRKTYVLGELLSQAASELFNGRDAAAWRAIAIALLDDFWAYAADHFPNGEVTKAHPATLQRALSDWIAGTEWAQKDPRDLLIRSGHLDKRRDGRIFIHDWMEWTGGSVLKLAKDRKRKRLARNRGVRARPRKVRGQSKPGPGLAVQSSAVQSSPVQSSSKDQKQPPAGHSLDYPTRCVIAVNQGLDRLLAGGFAALTVTEHGPIATAWESEGIPIELAEKILAERTAAFRSTHHNRQPHSLRYFDGAIREAWSKSQASETAAAGEYGGTAFREATIE